MAVRSLDDVTLTGATIGLRLDINSPIAEDGTLADDTRLRAHVDTVQELLEHGARVAILAHQGRPGGEQFTTLRPHAQRLDELLEGRVRYVDSTFSSDARAAIDALEQGEAIVLENVRFYSEEYMELTPERAGRTHLVEQLSGTFDLYVNDAFACAHRSHATVVGFPVHLPSVAGRVLEEELHVLGGLERTPTPRIALLAGGKADDSLRVARSLFERDLVDEVFAAGVVANLLFVAAGDTPGTATEEELERGGHLEVLAEAKQVLAEFGDRIRLPLDVAVEVEGDRREVDASQFPLQDGHIPRDIGATTIDQWSDVLTNAGTVVCNGPVGVFERDIFSLGTAAVYRAASEAAYSIAGGGDTAAALERFDIDQFDHVSTGGGAALALLSGQDLPGIIVLEECNIDLAN